MPYEEQCPDHHGPDGLGMEPTDYAFARAAAEVFGKAYARAPTDRDFSRLREDRRVVLVAVARDGFALRCAADELRADHEVVLAAVGQNGFALQYA
eukprot:568826-Amphidinium_carterae.1